MSKRPHQGRYSIHTVNCQPFLSSVRWMIKGQSAADKPASYKVQLHATETSPSVTSLQKDLHNQIVCQINAADSRPRRRHWSSLSERERESQHWQLCQTAVLWVHFTAVYWSLFHQGWNGSILLCHLILSQFRVFPLKMNWFRTLKVDSRI